MEFISKVKFYLLTAITIIIVMGILFNKPLMGEYDFSGIDSLSPKAINQGIISSQIENEKYPLWMPWIFSGVPSIHSFQNISNFYYPNVLNNFLQLIGFPKFWNYMIHFIISGLGILFICLKLRLSRYSALFGVITYILMPYSITMVVHGHGSQLMTLSWLPWFIWGILNLYDNVNFKSLGILSLIVGLQLQRAHVQIAYYSWMAACLLILILLINDFKQLNKEYKWIFYVIVGLLLGLCMAMWIYLPALNYTPYSIRGAGQGGGTGFDYATAWSFSFSEMATFLIPSFHGFGGATYWGKMPFTDYPNYMGILVVIFSIIGMLFSKNKIKWFFIIMIFFSLLLSFGKNFFLYEIFYDFFPFFNKFRVPAMFLVLTQFSVVIMSAFGVEIVINLIDEKKLLNKTFLIKLLLIPIFVILAIILMAFFVFPDFGEFPRYPQIRMPIELIDNIRIDIFTFDFYKSILIILLTLLTFYLNHIKLLKKNIIFLIIILLSIVDFYMVNKSIIDPEKNSLRQSTLTKNSFYNSYLESDDIIRFLKKDTTKYRILPLGVLSNENRWSAFQIESIAGYHPAKFHHYNKVKNEVGWSSLGLLQMLNVKYVITLNDFSHPDFILVFSGKLLYSGKNILANVYEFKKRLPRAFYVEKIKTIKNEELQIDFLRNKEFNPAILSFMDKEFKDFSYDPNSSIQIQHWSPDKIVLETVTSSRQLLVLSEIYYPEGWKITSKPEINIERINYLLRGFFIPEGSNEIVIEFIPDDIYYGRVITISSTIIIILLIIGGYYLEKRNNEI